MDAREAIHSVAAVEVALRTEMSEVLWAYMGVERMYSEELLTELVDTAMNHVKHLLVRCACDEQREAIDHG